MYTESISFKKIDGSSSVNTITFQSETGINSDVMIQAESNDSTGYVIKFNSCSFFRIKNVSIKIVETPVNFGSVVGFFYETNNTRIEGCILYGIKKDEFNDSWSVIYSATASNNNSIINNTILDGSFGICWSTNFNVYSEGLVIQGNLIKESYYGIYITQSDDLRIIGNIITTSHPDILQTVRVGVYSSTGFEISKNKLNFSAGSGMLIANCVGNDSSKLVLTNNIITGSSNGYVSYGLVISRSTYLEIYHNTIQVASKIDAAMEVGDLCDKTKLYNNVFSNIGGGYAIRVSDQYPAGGSDYNCFYTNGPNFSLCSSVLKDFSGFKAITKMDGNSICVLPEFISTDDLHAKAGSPWAVQLNR
ncbi:MAG: NosD domain-containing protein [Bacteroidia bacterium]